MECPDDTEGAPLDLRAALLSSVPGVVPQAVLQPLHA